MKKPGICQGIPNAGKLRIIALDISFTMDHWNINVRMSRLLPLLSPAWITSALIYVRSTCKQQSIEGNMRIE